MKRTMTFASALLAPLFLFAQQSVNYNDVAVIINENSPVSVEIGNYFQQQRDIPDVNMITINSTDEEEIDVATLEDIIQQIETYLTDNNLVDSINYLVTTKGVPLRVQNANCNDVNQFSDCSSFDSDLTLLLSSSSGEIGNQGNVENPYYDSPDHFDRSSFGIFLVTRLTGYTKEDVINMIDRSGPNTPVNQSLANSIFDVSFVTNQTELNLFEDELQTSIAVLEPKGWATTLDTAVPIVSDQQNVFGYQSINYLPTNGVTNFDWVAGSVAEITFGFSATTFEVANNTDNELIIANLIAEGATGAHGYAHYVYFGSSFSAEKMFDRYTNVVDQYNLAESYYVGIRRLSWQDVVVGDPKTSIIIDNTASITPPRLKELIIFPNPNQGEFTLRSDLVNIQEVEVFNELGQQVAFKEERLGQKIQLELLDVSDGVYFLQLATSDGPITGKVVVVK